MIARTEVQIIVSLGENPDVAVHLADAAKPTLVLVLGGGVLDVPGCNPHGASSPLAASPATFTLNS